jgi:inhibitor of nuclear factor kappa-B kinase subunit beta
MDVPFIGDWYREKKLGSGAFGSVDLWKNKKTNACVAIKKINASIFGDNSAEKNDDQINRWNNEIELMTTKIQHPNIVRTVDLKGSTFLEDLKNTDPRKINVLPLEFCEGGDLRKVLHRPANCNGLSELEVREILKSLSSAIGYLHSLNIIHRDIKPENIVLKKENGRIVYKVRILPYGFQFYFFLQYSINTNDVNKVG